MSTSLQPRTGVPPPGVSGPTLTSKECRTSSQGQISNPLPGRNVVLVIHRGNHSSQVSLITTEGCSRMYRMRRLLSKTEWLLVNEPEGRDLLLAALFLFMSCFAVPIPLMGLYKKLESVLEDLIPLALVAPTFLAWAALHAVPGRCE
jgi:hypothetical protein